jgi:pilus assembly protein TadC
MTTALALLAAALLAWPSPAAAVSLRLRAVRGRPLPAARRPPVLGRAGRRWVLAAGLGTAVALLLGGAWALAAGAVATLVAERVLRRREHSEDADVQALVLLRELPVACDLLAVCVAAGVPLPAALAAVGAAVPGTLGAELVRVAGARRLGADPRRAWQDVRPELGALARTVQRAETSGARAAPALQALAAETRATGRAAADAAVRRAGVWVLAPLGACFLPAFVCLGVVPLVIGIAGDALG